MNDPDAVVMRCEVVVEALDAEAVDAAPRAIGVFRSARAYGGGAISQSWSKFPVVVDLESIDLTDQVVPLQYEHQKQNGEANPRDVGTDTLLGQTTSLTTDGRELYASGEVLNDDSYIARNVVRMGSKGYRWQLSIGARSARPVEQVRAGDSIAINGREFVGPISVVRGAKIRELSITRIGADSSTSAAITAEVKRGVLMNEPNGKGEGGETVVNANAGPAAPQTPAQSAAPAAGAPAGEVSVKAHGGDGGSLGDGSPDVVASLRRELASARDDWAKRTADMEKRLALAEVRVGREGGIDVTAAEAPSRELVLEASLARIAGLRGWDKAYPERVLEAADKSARDVSLETVLVQAANQAGCTHQRVNKHTVVEIVAAAFAVHSLSKIFENVANKMLLAGFMNVDQSWRRIATTSNVNDFKPSKRYRINGSMQFARLGPNGEVKMVAAGDSSREVSAFPYGIGTTLTREQIINDDMSALAGLQNRVGRGGALALNELVWSTFLSGNASYYRGANPAAGNALSLTSLETAVAAYMEMQDTDGKPLGARPTMLLVPPALHILAKRLMNSQQVITGDGTKASGAREPQSNVLAGEYEVVTSPYLSNVKNAAGTQLGSGTTWWLATDPADFPMVEVAFLGGQQVPMIEQVKPDPFVPGAIGLVGTYDFGVGQAEDVACYRMAIA
jgi:hypothetical protein